MFISSHLLFRSEERRVGKECSMRFWCCYEALEEAMNGRCNMELVAGFGELDKTRFREALLELELEGLRYSE